MDTLHEAGIQGKLYRLWFMLNKDTQIKVKTSFGMTKCAATGENVAQGSIGGGIVSSLNLSKTISKYFSGKVTGTSNSPHFSTKMILLALLQVLRKPKRATF